MSGTSNLLTIMFLIKGNVGPGCLALPYYFSLLGPIYSIPVLGLVGGLCVYNMWLLANIRKLVSVVHPDKNIQTYGDLSSVILGKYGHLLQQAFLAFLQLGVCCIYVSFISNNILSLLPTSTNESNESTGTDDAESLLKLRAIMCGLAVPLFLLVHNLRTIQRLSTVSLIACVLLGTGMLTILCLCFGRLVANNYAVLNSSINLATGNTDEGEGFLLRNIKVSEVSLFVASTAYSYEGIGMILPIENAMHDRTAFGSCLFIAMSVVSFIFILFAEVCSLAFESLIHEGSMVKFLQMYYAGGDDSTDRAIMTLVNIVISISILFSYPLQLFPALEVIERVVAHCVGIEGSEYHSVHIGGDIELPGVNTYQQQVPSDTVRTPMHDTNGISNETVDTYSVNDILYWGLSVSTWCRVCCIGLTILIPIFIPYVVFLIPIAGASAGALLALIIPPIMDIVLTSNAKINADSSIAHLLDHQNLRMVINCVSVCVGVFCAVFGTLFAMQELSDYFRSKSSL